MAKCTFCGNAIEPGTGKMFIYVNGKIDNYCSNRCEKSVHKLKRKALKTRWTQTYRSNKSKRAESTKESKATTTKTAKVAKDVPINGVVV